MIKQKFGFTLAEVLIVIGIIGVVAALTLPNLNHATGDKETVTKVKKIYSALNDAFGRAEAIYGSIDGWCNDNIDDNVCNEVTAKRFLEFLKVSKDCATGTGCWASSSGTKSFSGYEGDSIDSFDGYYKALLSDGTSIAFQADSTYVYICFDIDGPNKGKNQHEHDIFSASIRFDSNLEENKGQTYGELYPSVAVDSQTGNLSDHDFNYGTAWIMQNDNIGYLKCYDDLNWETKTSCE